jgi:hypothetical protein
VRACMRACVRTYLRVYTDTHIKSGFEKPDLDL